MLALPQPTRVSLYLNEALKLWLIANQIEL